MLSLSKPHLRREAVVREAGTGYFDVMRIPIVTGRAFDARDNTAAPPRVVVSESLAETLFAREHAIGRHIVLGGGSRTVGTQDQVNRSVPPLMRGKLLVAFCTGDVPMWNRKRVKTTAIRR